MTEQEEQGKSQKLKVKSGKTQDAVPLSAIHKTRYDMRDKGL
ncbi:MAG: hypothetical protein ACYTFW_18305 [Planctomycetota bacterium]